MSLSGTSSQAGNASLRGVSSASGGTTPSACWRANVSSRRRSQPWSNLPLYLAAHDSATWCGAWLQPVEKKAKNGFFASWARIPCSHSMVLSAIASGR